jgi:hypothetical protein
MNVWMANDLAGLNGIKDGGRELTVSNAVVTLGALPAKAKAVLVSVKTKAVHVTFDGTDPASSGAGVYYAAGERTVWGVHLAKAARFIEAASGQAAVVRAEALKV